MASNHHGESKQNGVKNVNGYKAHKIRTEPFKWINFPIFVAIWFLLFWIIICPIVWSKVVNSHIKKHWPHEWPFYFWGVAFLIFCIIMVILFALWKYFKPDKRLTLNNVYNEVFLNPEFRDEKEIYCVDCSSFHAAGRNNCIDRMSDVKKCCNCGNDKESFNNCCHKKKKYLSNTGPSYDVVLKKQQPDVCGIINETNINRNDNKRNSLRSVKSRHSSSSSGVVISMHEIGTKNLITRNVENNVKPTKIDNSEKTFKSKKPIDLQHIDVDLANRHINAQFSGEKVLLSKDKDTNETGDKKTGSISSMESMDKKKFRQYLHLVEVNTPSTPANDTATTDSVDVAKSPISPREIFFYDLIQSADKHGSESSPDSTHFGLYKYEKKRPISHILLSSDVNFESDPGKIDVPKAKTLGRQVDGHNHPTDSTETTKTTVKILKTIKKSVVEVEPKLYDLKPYLLARNSSMMSEQNSAHDINNVNRESVSKFFISDINKPETKKKSGASIEKETIEEIDDSDANYPSINTDDVFTE